MHAGCLLSPRVAAPQAAAPAAWCPPAATSADGMCAVKHLLPLLRLQPALGARACALNVLGFCTLSKTTGFKRSFARSIDRAWTRADAQPRGKSVRPGGNA